MRLGFHCFFQAQRFVGFQRNQLGQAVAQGKRQFEHAADVADNRFGRHGAEGHNLAHRLAAVFFAHVFDHAAAVALAEVDIEVGHRYPLGVEEALEQQRVFQRVEVGNFQRIGYQRACARAAAGADRAAVVFRPVDEVLYDQEVARKAHLNNDVQLKIQPRLIFRHFFGALVFVGIELRHALLQAFVGDLDQIVIER